MSSPTDEKAGYPGVLKLEVEKYLPKIKEYEITDAQKAELLHTLWNIMSAFVDLGWDLNSIPEFLPELREISSDLCVRSVEIEDSVTSGFNGSAGCYEQGKDKEK